MYADTLSKKNLSPQEDLKEGLSDFSPEIEGEIIVWDDVVQGSCQALQHIPTISNVKLNAVGTGLEAVRNEGWATAKALQVVCIMKKQE